MYRPKSPQSLIHKLRKSINTLKSKKYGNLVIYAITFGIIGTVILIFSSAASTNNFIEPESGAISGNASVVSDATASNGSYVLFQACPAGQTGTPPNCVVPPPPTGGYGTLLKPFAATSLWNTPVASTATFSGTLPWPTTPTGSWWINGSGPCSDPIYMGTTADPLVNVITNYTGSTVYSPSGDPQNSNRWGRQANTAYSVRIPKGVNGAGQNATPGQCDGSLVIIDESTGISHDFWQFWRIDDTHATASGYGSSSYTTGTGWGIPSGTPSTFPGGINAGTTAAGSNKYAGTITQAQVNSGSIDHALAMACDLTRIGLPQHVLPAIWGDGVTAPAGFVHESDHLAIPTSVAKPSLVKSVIGNEVWNALVKYGAYCIDYAGGATILAVDTTTITQAEVDQLIHSTSSTWGTVGADEWPTMGVLLQKIQ